MSTRLCRLLLLLSLLFFASPHLSAAPLISNINTDKAAYRPTTAATIYLDLLNLTGMSFNGSAELAISHLGYPLASLDTKSITSLAPGGTSTKIWSWTPPSKDYQGYLISITIRNQLGAIVDAGSSAVDVSSDWSKFPRYGFVTRYEQGLDAYNIMWQLKNHHINGVQFYDWQWKHHVPYTSSTSWSDIANRTVQRSTLASLISAAHSYSMVAMNYNLYGGAYDNYPVDGSGVQLSMGIFSGSRPAAGYSISNQLNFSIPAGWATPRLYQMNNRDTAWQNYIFAREQTVFNNLGFDGWHIDSLGVHHAYDYSGAFFSLDDYNPQFINNARTNLARRMLFNTVDAGGESQVAQNANVDFVYSELWGDNPDYIDFNRRTDNVRKQGSKAVVFAAYLNRGLSSGTFNEAGVRLADAAIFASGAAHLELGDGDRMLHHEYFPNNGSVLMTSSLRAALRTYYDFLVGYENLLRDGTVSSQHKVSISAVGTSTTGTAGTVWTLSRKTLGYTILHCINLLKNPSSAWRDNLGTYPAPDTLTNLSVKMYYTAPLGSGKLWYATPDFNFGAATELTYTNNSDAGGTYVQFVLPRLHYWDMVWLEMKGLTSASTTFYATNYHTMAAVSTEPTADEGGGFDICCVNNTAGGGYLAFNSVDFSNGYSNVSARVASPLADATIEFRLDSLAGPLVAVLPVGNTGGWQNWQTINAPVTNASGVHQLFVVFRNAPSNLNWFKFSLSPYERPLLIPMPESGEPFRFLITGQTAPECVILASTNLVDWVPLFTTNSPVLPFLWTDPNPPSSSSRFYKVRLGP